jgi:hypothetical protein
VLLKSKEHFFRSIDFDHSIEDVKNNESFSPELAYADYLRYHVMADSVATGESVDVEYFFNKKNSSYYFAPLHHIFVYAVCI